MADNNGNNGGSSQSRWHEMLGRLKAYKAANGHCLVPNRYEDDPQLGAWVSTQRRQYKLYEMKSGLAIKLLDEIGFSWSAKSPRHLQWEQRYRALLDFQKRFGHVQVPIQWEEDIQLANWVSTQRQEYQNLLKGKTTRLDQRRVRLLNGIGFAWQLQRGGRRRRLRVEAGESKTGVRSSELPEKDTDPEGDFEEELDEAAAYQPTADTVEKILPGAVLIGQDLKPPTPPPAPVLPDFSKMIGSDKMKTGTAAVSASIYRAVNTAVTAPRAADQPKKNPCQEKQKILTSVSQMFSQVRRNAGAWQKRSQPGDSQSLPMPFEATRPNRTSLDRALASAVDATHDHGAMPNESIASAAVELTRLVCSGDGSPSTGGENSLSRGPLKKRHRKSLG